MKNKIIALFLVVVMATLALASCSKPYSYTDEDLGDYITITDKDGFLAALQDIKIEDADFTNDEATRQKKVTAKIYSALADFAEKNGEKKTEGTMDDDDTFYYAYYITYKKAGEDAETVYVYNVDEYMKETASPKSSIKLSAIDVNDDKADKLSVAIKNALFNEETKTYEFDGYKTVTTTETDINKDTKYAKAIVSYTLTTGEGDSKQVKIANAEIIDLGAEGDSIEAQIAAVLNGSDNKVQIYKNENYVEVCTAIDGDNKTYSKTFPVKDGETNYTCSDLKVLFAVENAGNELKVEGIKLTSDTKLTSSKIDNLHPDGITDVTIPKDAEVTYYVYPVYYYEVSGADSAAAIVRQALADKITVDSLDVFSDESYKNGDKTVKALVEELVAVYKENTSTKIDELKKAYDAAAKVVTDAGDAATDEQKTAEADAKKAYEDAKNAATNKVSEIVAATNSESKSVADVIVEQYRESTYEGLEDAYDDAIFTNVGKEIWSLIQKYAVPSDYPAELVEEAKAHLYNQYEYEFYNNSDESTGKSYYSEYGDFDSYLFKVTSTSTMEAVDDKIEEQAKAFVLPVMQIYAAAKVLSEDGASTKLPAQIEANKDAIEDLGEHSERRELETVEYFAENFYITDEVFKGYKKMVGKREFEANVDSYGGETNVRTAHQVSNIFDYLLMMEYTAAEADGDHAHAEIKYKEVEGKKYLSFYNISYSFK